MLKCKLPLTLSVAANC